MKTVFRINFGKERVDKWTKESKETFMEDPLIENDWWIENNNILW